MDIYPIWTRKLPHKTAELGTNSKEKKREIMKYVATKVHSTMRQRRLQDGDCHDRQCWEQDARNDYNVA